MENSAVSNFISCYTTQWRKPAQVQHPLNDVPVITSEKMTASQALIQYKGRDISEILFRADKSFIGSKSKRV